MLRKPITAGFSLVELLISVLLIATLYAVVLGPSAGQVKARQFAACAENLRKIHLALGIYANEHNSAYPSAPGATSSEQPLSLLVPKCTTDTSVFTCPATGRAPLRQGQAFSGRRISYAYVSGLSRNDPPGTPLACDTRTGDNHKKSGGNVLFIDGHVEQVAPNPPHDLALPAHAVWLESKQ